MSSFKENSSFLKGHGVTESVAAAQRMHERHKRIIEANPDSFQGKTVLDLASHNGRWTYAALEAGATFALGIEARQELISRGIPEFVEIPQEKYQFICGDIFDQQALASAAGYRKFDTVLCLGIFYHITDHYRLIRQMRSFNPSSIIFDSSFLTGDTSAVRFRQEDSSDPSNALPEHDDVSGALKGLASIGFMRQTAALSGYDMHIIPWRRDNTDHPESVEDYLDSTREARRLTMIWKAKPDKPTW
jgi:hypothetical protein